VTWLDPMADPDGDGFQITQSRGAIVYGGIFGRGYLKGEQKVNRLPLSTKDFIYPVMVEELGLVGGLAIIALFALVGFSAGQLARCCRDRFHRTVIAGLGLAVALQAFVNIGTTVGALPVSGITLPFFSGGGTSIVVSILCFGLMAGLAREELAPRAARAQSD
jgi:cell division protein FtsW (lipid II flippase)